MTMKSSFRLQRQHFHHLDLQIRSRIISRHSSLSLLKSYNFSHFRERTATSTWSCETLQNYPEVNYVSSELCIVGSSHSTKIIICKELFKHSRSCSLCRSAEIELVPKNEMNRLIIQRWFCWFDIGLFISSCTRVWFGDFFSFVCKVQSSSRCIIILSSLQLARVLKKWNFICTLYALKVQQEDWSEK